MNDISRGKRLVRQRYKIALCLVLWLFSANFAMAQQPAIDIEGPELAFIGQTITLNVSGQSTLTSPLQLFIEQPNQTAMELPVNENKVSFTPMSFGQSHLTVKTQNGKVLASHSIIAIFDGFSLLPPLLAILTALLLRSVIPALFIGVFSGAWLLLAFDMAKLPQAMLDPFQLYAVNALANESHVSIVMFTMMMGGMIGIISKNGGMQGIVRHLMKFTHNRKRGQLATAGLGGVIFFDDIANTLLIGKTMRPIFDKLKISRAKLAYLIDSTAAPIASIAFATTWIGYEVSVIAASIEQTEGLSAKPYALFLSALPYSFYSFTTLFLVFLIAYSGRDFGPMSAAERKTHFAESDFQTEDKPNAAQHSALGAILPIVSLVATLIAGLLLTGDGETLQQILGTADSYKALMWASFTGVLVAMAITLFQRVLNLEQVIESWIDGMQSTFAAMIVLVLSWSLADITQQLNTADYIVSLMNASVSLALLPTIAFVIAGIVAFATGTSWGTMGIMMPLVLPLAWSMLGQQGFTEVEFHGAFLASIAAILAGATWGDHCSPISDTTILASVAADCELMTHVKTQVPYALVSGGVAIVLGTLPAGFGVPWYICWGLSFLTLFLIVRYFGRPLHAQSDSGIYITRSTS